MREEIKITIFIIVVSLIIADKVVYGCEKDVALLLAKTCVAEIGFRKNPQECLVMWEINGDNAKKRGRTIERQTLLFNAYWKIPKKKRKRNWIAGLNRTNDKPALWPKSYDWSKYKNRWNAYVNAADQFENNWVNGSHKRLCPQASDYGAPGIDTPKHACARVTKCLRGKTAQRYWDLSCRRRR